MNYSGDVHTIINSSWSNEASIHYVNVIFKFLL